MNTAYPFKELAEKMRLLDPGVQFTAEQICLLFGASPALIKDIPAPAIDMYEPCGAQLRERTIQALLASPLANSMSPTDIFNLAQSIQAYVEDGTVPAIPVEWDAGRFSPVVRRICDKGLFNKVSEHLSEKQIETLSKDLTIILEKLSPLLTAAEGNKPDSSTLMPSADLSPGIVEAVTVDLNPSIKSISDRVLFALVKKMDNCNLSYGAARRYIRNGNVSICGKENEKVITDENCRVISGTIKFRRNQTLFVAEVGDSKNGSANFLLSNAAWPETLP